MSAPDKPFTFGKPAIAKLGVDCCGKPQGCTNPSPTCIYQGHPYKRWSRGEITLDELNRLMAGISVLPIGFVLPREEPGS